MHEQCRDWFKCPGLGLGILIFVCWPVPLNAQDAAPQLVNGNFEQWNDAGPVGWILEIGATNGADQPKSIVRQGEGPSLELSGDRSTLAWQMVSQSVAVKPGDAFRFTYQVKTSDLRRQGNQFDNCYVGIFQKDKRGQVVSRNFWQNNTTEYTDVVNFVRIEPKVAEAQVAIFLSKSGTLNVQNVSLERLRPEDSFDILVADMDRHYSFFEHKGVDWPDLVGRYRERAESAKTPAAFTKVITELLAELQDVHTWVVHGGKRHAKFTSGSAPNYDFRVVESDLADKKRIRGLGLVGKTSDGFGYVRVNSLSGVDANSLKQLVSEMEKLFDTPGIIIDLRRNGGGAEPVAMQIVSLLADEPRVYARQNFRASENHADFYETAPRQIVPRDGTTYAGPIVCLTGPGAVSSAEGMALMLAALPNCTLVGQPTRGASGNPAAVQLPNGVDVWYSRWMALTAEGIPIEGDGVQPDIVVEHGEGDPTFEKAKSILQGK